MSLISDISAGQRNCPKLCFDERSCPAEVEPLVLLPIPLFYNVISLSSNALQYSQPYNSIMVSEVELCSTSVDELRSSEGHYSIHSRKVVLLFNPLLIVSIICSAIIIYVICETYTL